MNRPLQNLLSSQATEFGHSIPLRRSFSGILPNESDIPYFFSLKEGQNLEKVLAAPYRYLIEATQYQAAQLSHCRAMPVKPSLCLNISTHTAYKHNPAWCLTHEMCRRFGFGANVSNNIMTCLHEAIANAIIHGNMGLKDAGKDLCAYYKQLEERIEILPERHKRINISAWHTQSTLVLSVCDEGRGFSFPDARAMKKGHGLHLIHALADTVSIGTDRRTLRMTFNYG